MFKRQIECVVSLESHHQLIDTETMKVQDQIKTIAHL